ncbi:MAG: GAF domain-containing protein [Armatimonadetes bacterium]|nr:GAF domain-containing protein [Armatimonadota bacterium]
MRDQLVGGALSWSLLAGLALFGFDLLMGLPVRLDGAFLVFFAGAVWLELLSVRLPGFGHYSGAAACYMAAILELGAAGAAWLAIVGVLVRSLRAGGRHPAAAAAAEVVPLLAAAAAAASWEAWRAPDLPAPFEAVAAWIAVTVYLALAWWLPPRLAGPLLGDEILPWMRVRRSLRELQAVLAVSGVAMAWLAAVSWWYPVMVFPLLWVTHRAMENALFRVQAVSAFEAREQVQGLQEALDAAQTEMARAQDRLRLGGRLEQFARDLARAPDQERTLDLILSAVLDEVSCSSVVVFLSPDGRRGSLHPAAFRSPSSERLRDAALLGLREPLVEEAWTRARPVSLTESPPTAERLLSGERTAVAVPLRREGVLYVGREDGVSFGGEELRRLLWLADKAGLALATSRRQVAQEEALWRERQEAAQLQGQVTFLTALLESARGLAASLESGAIVAAARESLQTVLPHSSGCLCWREEWHRWGEPAEEGQADVIAAVRESQRPLLLPGVRESRFSEGFARDHSLCCAPLVEQGRSAGPTGAILLLRDPGAPFHEAEADLLHMLAFQLALALSNSERYQEVVEARRRLAESQAQLVESSKMTAVGQLAAGVAHELNTPLGAVRVALESTQMLDLKPEAARSRLERALSACHRAQNIVDRLLVYSRGGQGRVQFFPPDRIVQDTLVFLRSHLHQRGARVETELRATREIQGSCEELQQVLINLLLNAVDAVQALPPERQVVTVACRDEKETEVVLEVIDRGEGLAPGAEERLFEPFFTTKPVGRGTGLGLSVSREIVERHGGRIEVRSHPGEGCRFSVRLPARCLA